MCYSSIRVIEREGEYPITLWYCIATLYGDHDFCNDIHNREVLQ